MKYIIFGFEHYNPLGIVRSLGENGIKPYGIIIRNSRKITSKSKFFKRVFFVNSILALWLYDNRRQLWHGLFWYGYARNGRGSYS